MISDIREHPVRSRAGSHSANYNSPTGEDRVLLKTILNRVQKFPSHVYDTVRLVEDGAQMLIEVLIQPRANGKVLCSRCHKPGPRYDTMSPPRRFDFVPLWGIPVVFVYTMRRVNCRRCGGVYVEAIPWAEGKQRTTHAFNWFLASWARRLSWKETAKVFHTSWDTVARAVRRAVDWGLAHRRIDEIKAIGIDEIAYKKGHKYLTVVYQIEAECRRLLWIGKGRHEKTLKAFFEEFGDALEELEFAASDMWRPYLNVVAEHARGALHVLDRFHIMGHFSKAIDKIRAQEVRDLKRRGLEPVLKGSRFLLLKRPENLTEKQDVKLAELLRYNLKAVRAYLLKEDFQLFWDYVSPYWAGWFLDRWCKRAMRSRIDPIKKVARSLRGHRELLLNWFRARGEISSGIVEGFNNKAKVTMRKAYGYRSYENLEAALYHGLGKLPEPESTHRFGGRGKIVFSIPSERYIPAAIRSSSTGRACGMRPFILDARTSPAVPMTGIFSDAAQRRASRSSRRTIASG
jgi:transposase